MSAFDQAFAFVIGAEGGFTNNPKDPGNWTEPNCTGKCAGTKYGISARAYPSLDIVNLTLDQAQAIYRRDYWDKIAGDHLPPPLALLVFDAAVNNGIGRAVLWVQAAVGVEPDGILGPITLGAMGGKLGVDLCVEFQAQRLAFMGGLPTWKNFGLGWSRRLSRLPFQAIQMGIV